MDRKSSVKFFYGYVKNVTGNKTNTDVAQLKFHDVIFDSDFQKALALSDQYKSVYNPDNGDRPICEQKVPENSFCQINVTENEILAAINQMNVDNASGPDEVNAKFINEIKCFLIFPLKLIFQNSFNTGTVPYSWRKGIITPIYKNNRKPHDPASYRPVCLTSVIGKLAERVLLYSMLAYMHQNNLISPAQHAFIVKKSTGTNLLECLNEWTTAIDHKMPVDIMYIDLEKAFDSVPHAKLLYKLRKVGVGGIILKWLASFLTQREHCVRVNDAQTPYEVVESGIAQGTILGPMMFILYINDVVDLSLSSKVILYADDAKIYRTVLDQNDTAALQDDINKVSEYFTSWQLRINTRKCDIIHLGRTNPKCDYMIENHGLQASRSCRDLGIKVSQDEKFSLHILDITRSAFFRLRQLNLAFSCKDAEFQKHMFTTYVRPLLESNTYVWSPHLLKDIDALEAVQKRFTRNIPQLAEKTYLERLQHLGLTSLEERRIIFDLTLVYKMFHGLIDLKIEDFFTLNQNSTRGHNFKLNVCYSRVNYRKYFFSNRIVPIWNNLPSDSVNSQSLYAFKKSVNRYGLISFIVSDDAKRGHAITTQSGSCHALNPHS